MVAWYKGDDTDDKRVILGSNGEFFHTHEQAIAVAESVNAAASNPSGATGLGNGKNTVGIKIQGAGGDSITATGIAKPGVSGIAAMLNKKMSLK